MCTRCRTRGGPRATDPDERQPFADHVRTSRRPTCAASNPMPSDRFTVSAAESGATVAKWLRARLPGHSWNQIRRLIETRCVQLNGELCLDPARRLKEGDKVELLARPAPKPRQQEA